MTVPSNVLIVGASLGGLSVVEALRREGYTGRIALVGAEKHPPYDRPPLSKKVLGGEAEPAKAQLRTETALAKLDAEWILGEPAVRLDARTREVHTASGRMLHAEAIVLATGLVPRRLSGQDAWAGVHVLRTIEDSVALRADLLAHKRLVVVGDGVLGTEIAATARSMGLAVTLVGPQSAPLANQLGLQAGAYLAKLHTEKGVELRMGVGVQSFEGTDGRVSGVCLQNGDVLVADIVVVAIGSRPATDWLLGSDLELADGIVCDAQCRAAEGIYAVGDVARWHHEGLGRTLRLENRSNAVEQGMLVAANIMGKNRSYTPIPFFWSDQYETKIQMHGFVPDQADFAVIEGDPEKAQFVALYGASGRVTGVLGWNMVKQCRQHRQHVVDGTNWSDIVSK